MAPTSRFALLGRTPAKQEENDGPNWNKGNVPPRDPKTMTKAERLLGMGDNIAQPQRKMFEPKRKVFKGNVFTNAFSEWKGVLAGSSSNSGTSSHGRGTPSSPAVKTNVTDSDSMVSMASPTFDGTNSTSTLPSYYDQPTSPYFNTRNSSGPSSPHDFEMRQDYHAVITNNGKIPFGSDMPAISEIYDPEEKNTELPPLEKPPLSPTQPTTPRTRNSFGHVTRLRSPSSTSVATESTAKGKFFGWRQSRMGGKEYHLEPSPRITERGLNSSFAKTDSSGSSKSSSAVEDWLARADLDRRPSQSSAMTKMTAANSVVSSAFSPSSSQLSVRTFTTDRGVNAPFLTNRPGRRLRHSKSSDEILSHRRTISKPVKGDCFEDKNLLIESFLEFSSSEDEESDGEGRKKKRASKRLSIIRSATSPGDVRFYLSRSSFDSTSTSTLQPRHHASGSLDRAISSPKPIIKHRQHNSESLQSTTSGESFQSVKWRSGDTTELGNICVATAAKIYPSKGEKMIEIQSKRPSIQSQISPTSRVMVISKKEQKLLAAIRERSMDPGLHPLDQVQVSVTPSVTTSAIERANFPSSLSPPTTNPIISVSPPRRKVKRPSTSTSDRSGNSGGWGAGGAAAPPSRDIRSVDEENEVISFPTPPTPKGKNKAFALNLSTESLSDLPEVVPLNYGSTISSSSRNGKEGTNDSNSANQEDSTSSPSDLVSPLDQNVGFGSVSEVASGSDETVIGAAVTTGTMARSSRVVEESGFGSGYGRGKGKERSRSRSRERQRVIVPPVPGLPVELYGSVPDLTEVLHTGLGQKNSTRSRARSNTSTRTRIFNHTGLENVGLGSDDGLEGEDDIKRYVMASVM